MAPNKKALYLHTLFTFAVKPKERKAAHLIGSPFLYVYDSNVLVQVKAALEAIECVLCYIQASKGCCPVCD